MKDREDNINYRDDSRFDPNTNILNQEGIDNIPNQRYQDDSDITLNSLKNAGIFNAMMNGNNNSNNNANNQNGQNNQNQDDIDLEDNLNINQEIENYQNNLNQQNQQNQPNQEPVDPANDGSDFTEEHNQFAYAETRRLLGELKKDFDILKASGPNTYTANKQRVSGAIMELAEHVNSFPAIKDQFPDGWDETLQDNLEKKGAKGIENWVDFQVNKWQVQPQMANNAPNANANQPGPGGNPPGQGDQNNGNDNNDDTNLDNQINALRAQQKKMQQEQQRLNDQIAALEAQKKGKNNEKDKNKDKNKDKKKGKDKKTARDKEFEEHFGKLNGFQKTKDGKGIEKFFFWDDITPEQREQQIKASLANGYKNKEKVSENITTKQQETVSSLKLYARELKKFGKMGARSPQFKEMMKDLEALDKFMQEIGGRTRLTADEMEAYDMLSLKAYNSTRNYEDYKKEQIKNRKKQKDPYNNGEEGYPAKESEIQRLKGVNDIKQSLGKLREEMFKKEIEEKTKEMQAKCDEQIDKLEEEREKLADLPTVPGGENKATREAMEKNIANTLFYSNRMADLGKQGRLTMNPGKALGQNFNNLDKELTPGFSSLEAVKKSPLFKEVVDAAMAKAEKGETLTAEEIKSIQQAYVKKLGNKKRRSNQLNKNINNTRKKGPQDPQLGANQPRPAM